MLEKERNFQDDNSINKKSIKIVSVSIGSSKRNKKVHLNLLGKDIVLERLGTDSSVKKARELVRNLDGKVDAFGLGGTNLYVRFNDRLYSIRDAHKIAAEAKISPMVCGFYFKEAYERKVLDYLQEHKIVNFYNKKVLMVSGLDRGGMAEWFLDRPEIDVKFGDLFFTLRMPIVTTNKTRFDLLEPLARTLFPLVLALPFKLFYPTGKKQQKHTGRCAHLFDWADIIVGDFHYIRRYASDDLTGKVVITSTTTMEDVELMKSRGVSKFITTTPQFDGRSFGSNLLDALIVALSGKTPEALTPEDYQNYIDKLNISPNVIEL